MCESYFGLAKSDPIKRLAQLSSEPIKRSRLYVYGKVETASTKYHFNRIMVRPNNLVNRIMVKPNNLVNQIFDQPNNTFCINFYILYKYLYKNIIKYK